MIIPNVPKSLNPASLDKVIEQIQDELKLKLPWLNYSFGRAQKLVKIREHKDYYYPGVHIEKGEYVSMFPDSTFGNYSFFFIEDPQEGEFERRTASTIRSKLSLIVWVNLDNIAGEALSYRSSEAIKEQILKVLINNRYAKFGRFTIQRIYEQAENIYKGFSLKEVDTQFLMQPYAGFRFDGELIHEENYCNIV